MTITATVQVGQFGRPILSKDGRTITVKVPITLRQRGGRKYVVTPAGATPWIPTPPRIDNTLVKAIVRAHRWRNMLESGGCATVRDLATAEAINESYLGRVLRLTLSPPRSSKPSWKECSRQAWSSTAFSGNSLSNGTSSSRH
jgi:hypothetical protein